MRISDWSSDVCSSDLIATAEANADLRYKQAIVEYSGTDIVYSNLFTGVHGNYLRASIEAAGFDPDHLPQSDPSKMNFGSGGNISAKAWQDIWGCGKGIGGIKSIVPAAEQTGSASGREEECQYVKVSVGAET